MDAACAMAASNPMVTAGAHVEVAEIMPLEM